MHHLFCSGYLVTITCSTYHPRTSHDHLTVEPRVVPFVIMRWSPWYRGYRVVGYSWCCARIMGKDQAPCGHLMITTVLFIPSLIWSWDDRVMSEVGKWCICWLLSTLYPHYGTHGLALPFGWTNGVPTKPIYCHDTLPATPTHSPLG